MDWDTRTDPRADHQNSIRDVCREYAGALEAVRLTWRTSAENRQIFCASARKFQDAMCPFVLRRDKRDDEPIKSFLQMKGEGIDSYRRETPFEIWPEQLSPQWLDAVIAAEGLSAIKDTESDRSQQDKRLRLTIGNGHGISAMIDSAVDEEAVPKDEGASVTHGDGKYPRSPIGVKFCAVLSEHPRAVIVRGQILRFCTSTLQSSRR